MPDWQSTGLIYNNNKKCKTAGCADASYKTDLIKHFDGNPGVLGGDDNFVRARIAWEGVQFLASGRTRDKQ